MSLVFLVWMVATIFFLFRLVRAVESLTVELSLVADVLSLSAPDDAQEVAHVGEE